MRNKNIFTTSIIISMIATVITAFFILKIPLLPKLIAVLFIFILVTGIVYPMLSVFSNQNKFK